MQRQNMKDNELMSILTFIKQEERKEPKEHERLEVVHGIYWVLKA